MAMCDVESGRQDSQTPGHQHLHSVNFVTYHHNNGRPNHPIQLSGDIDAAYSLRLAHRFYTPGH